MKICKVKASTNDCCACIDYQIYSKILEDCSRCLFKKDYELLKIVTPIFGKPYALLIIEGKIAKIPLKRIYDVREADPFETYELAEKGE